MKPNFLIIGAMKSGTTSFHSILSQHPDVFMSKLKEPEFFCRDRIYKRGWEWYESLFANARGKLAIGEASTSYTKKGDNYSPHTAERIAKHLPNVKLIYIVRNPLERIESHWRQGRNLGWCSQDFDEAVLDPRVINPSRYWWQINVYRDLFPDLQIKVLFFEDFKREPHTTVQKCLDFLGVDSQISLPNIYRPKNISKNWEKPKWDYRIKQKVINQIYKDSQCFLKFYGKPANFWKFEDDSLKDRKKYAFNRSVKTKDLDINQGKFPNDMIVFIHIPKTAGTSLRSALEKQIKVAYDYGPEEQETSKFIKETFYQGKYDDFVEVIHTEKYKCLVGHFDANKYSNFFSNNTKIVTFFREPIQRCISGYLHMHRHYGYDETIENFAEQNHNSQTRFISQIKLQNILFGITEDYENSMELLSKQLGINLTPIRINVNPKNKLHKKYKCDPYLLKLFEANSSEDLKLYQDAKKVFYERLVSEGIRNLSVPIKECDDVDAFYEDPKLKLTNFESIVRCAQFLEKKEYFIEASSLYTKALNINPNSHSTFYDLGKCLAKQKKFDEAIQCYQKAIEIEPNYYLYYHSFGDARFEQKRWKDAIACYEQSILLNSDFSWSHYNKGRAYANQKMFEQAINLYIKALEINPQFVECKQSLEAIRKLQKQGSFKV